LIEGGEMKNCAKSPSSLQLYMHALLISALVNKSGIRSSISPVCSEWKDYKAAPLHTLWLHWRARKIISLWLNGF